MLCTKGVFRLTDGQTDGGNRHVERKVYNCKSCWVKLSELLKTVLDGKNFSQKVSILTVSNLYRSRTHN